DKGDPLPRPEQAEYLRATAAFGPGDRLMAVAGNRRVEVGRTVTGADGFGGPGGFGGGPPAGKGGKGANPGAGGGPPRPRVQVMINYAPTIGVWEASTGKRLRSWDHQARMAVHPTRPVVAILEDNGSGGVRLGLWDFAAEGDGGRGDRVPDRPRVRGGPGDRRGRPPARRGHPHRPADPRPGAGRQRGADPGQQRDDRGGVLGAGGYAGPVGRRADGRAER